MRTGGGAALSVRMLARTNAKTLAILGAGVQGHSHLATVPLVRDFTEIRVTSRDIDTAHVLAALDPRCVVVESFEDAVRGADVVCCCTDAREPITHREWFSPGTHVTSVGGTFGPELDPETDAPRTASSSNGRARPRTHRPRARTSSRAAIPSPSPSSAKCSPDSSPAARTTTRSPCTSRPAAVFEDAVTARMVYDAAVAAHVGTERRVVTALPALDADRPSRYRTAACAAHPSHTPDSRTGRRVSQARIDAADRQLQGARILRAAHAIDHERIARGILSVSAGNAALACAYVAHALHVPCRVVMYENAPRLKLDGVRALGAEPVLLLARWRDRLDRQPRMGG